MTMRGPDVQTWNTWPSLEAPRWSPFTLLAVLVLGGLLAVSWHIAQIDPALLFGAEGRRHIWAFLKGLFPPELSPEFLKLDRSLVRGVDHECGIGKVDFTRAKSG